MTQQVTTERGYRFKDETMALELVLNSHMVSFLHGKPGNPAYDAYGDHGVVFYQCLNSGRLQERIVP